MRGRQAELGESFAAGTLLAVAMERAGTDLRAREEWLTGLLAAASVANPASELAAVPDPAARWDELPLLARRRVIDALVDTAIQPAEPGRAFDPRLVDITRKGGAA